MYISSRHISWLDLAEMGQQVPTQAISGTDPTKPIRTRCRHRQSVDNLEKVGDKDIIVNNIRKKKDKRKENSTIGKNMYNR